LVETLVSARRLVLQPGRSLLAALVEAAAPSGAASAVLTLAGGSLFPFSHVMPALARTPEHAVYFSERFDAAAPVRLEFATVTYGQNLGRPWLHCHALWTDTQGQRHCGHLLPDVCVLAEPLPASAWLLDSALFQVGADDETGFSLFKPVAAPRRLAPPAGRPALALRLAPNEDVCTALEAICQARGISQASVRGGVGSTVGAVFDDGRRVEPFVTETLVRQGRIVTGPDGAPRAEIDVSMVDHLGGQTSGRLARGANPVLVTFELVLEPA
jgi:predicted DNA-binding protein with PD1-like motif